MISKAPLVKDPQMVVPALLATIALLQAAPGQERPPSPIQPPATWFSTEDYPAEARKQGVEGIVHFTLAIDADGMPTSCTVAEPGESALGAATCSLVVGRARFLPARDSAGRAAPGTFSSSIAWRLPPLPPVLPFAPLRIANAVLAPADGTTRCSREVDGRERSPAGIEICGVALAMGLEEALRRREPGAQAIVVLTIEPDGEPLPSDDLPASGTLLHREAAAIVLTPGGQLSVCYRTPARRGVRSREMEIGPDLCLAYLRHGGPDFAAGPDARGRGGHLTLSIYLSSAAEN